MNEQIQNLLDNEPALQEFKNAIKNWKPKPYTKEEREQIAFEELKRLYLEENPYPKPSKRVFGDPHSNWEFDRADKINYTLRSLEENGRQDLIGQFEQFKKETLALKEQKIREQIIKNLADQGIDLKNVDSNIVNYIIYLEKRLNNLK